MDRKTPIKPGTKKDILAPTKKAPKVTAKSKDGVSNEAPKKPKKVNSKFQGLLTEMKSQPKDAKGKFIDRDFAKYVSKSLAEVRKSKKTK